MLLVATQKPILVALMMAGSIALLIINVMTRHTFAKDTEKTPALVVRVAVFSNDQGRLDDYRDFVDGHLFPTLRAVPGYVGTFLGRDANSGQRISLSFWRSEADAVYPGHYGYGFSSRPSWRGVGGPGAHPSIRTTSPVSERVRPSVEAPRPVHVPAAAGGARVRR